MTLPTTTSSRSAEGDSAHKDPGLRRALCTSSVGSALEYYDFAPADARCPSGAPSRPPRAL